MRGSPDGERAAHAGCALDPDLPAHEGRQASGEGEAEADARPIEAASRAAVDLGE